MYKYYIRKWGMRKYTTQAEAQAIVRKDRQRKVLGRCSTFAVGDRTVTLREAEISARRARIRLYTSQQRHTACKTPPTVRCKAPDIYNIQPPESLKASEMLYFSTKEQITYHFDTMWIRSPQGILRYLDREDKLRPLNGFRDSIRGAVRLLSNGESVTAVTLANLACSLLEEMFRTPHPNTTTYLGFLIEATRFTAFDLITVTWRHFCGMSTAINGTDHPIRNIHRGLASIFLQPGTGDHLFLNAWRMMGDVLEQRLGSIDCTVLTQRRDCFYLVTSAADRMAYFKRTCLQLHAIDNPSTSELKSLCMMETGLAQAYALDRNSTLIWKQLKMSSRGPRA